MQCRLWAGCANETKQVRRVANAQLTSTPLTRLVTVAQEYGTQSHTALTWTFFLFFSFFAVEF